MVDEGSDLVLSCMTGSIFYPASDTIVTWNIFDRLYEHWKQMNQNSQNQSVMKRPTSLEVNKLMESVSNLRMIATRNINQVTVKCMLVNKQYLVESQNHTVTVYCKYEN